MRRDRPARRSILWLALAALSIVGCGEELPTPAGAEDGFERTVLAELFTAVWCGNCPIAEAALDRLVDEEGIGRLAVIHWHPSFGAGDPLSIPAADERVGFYESLIGQQPGLPVNVFNGALGISQGTRETYGLYRARFEIEAALRSPVAIAIEPSLAGSQVDALVRVSGFPGCGSLGLDLHLVAVEHHAPNPGRTGPAVLSYTARAAVAATVEVQGGQSRTLSLSLPLDPGWKREDLFLVAFVQEPAAAAGRTFREVLQARMVPLVEEGEDFHAFLLSAPGTDRGVARNATSALPWRAHNVGTLADTLEIDLPAELQSLPEGWTAALSDEEGGVLALPRREALAPGGTLARLRLSVTAAESGEASLALCARSIGDPALADTLRFRLTAGDFGFLLASAATEVRAVAGQTARVDFSAANTGTLADSLAFTLPAELNGLPAGWTATLASAQGHALGAAHTLHLPAGGSPATLGLAVTPGGEGEGALAVVARSRYAPESSDTLRFQVRSRLYAVALSAPAAEVWAVVGRPASIAFSALNRSTRADIVTLDVPAALQSLPSGWRLELAGLDGVPVAVPRSLLIEAGCSHALLALLVTPAGPGSARVRLTAASAGDPRAADTLSLTVRADAYGLDISAPEGTALPLAPGATKLAPLRLANTGTLGDTLVLDLPAALMQLPAGWQADLVTAGGTQLYLPDRRMLAAGAVVDSLRLRVTAAGSGSGTLGLVVSSTGQPALIDTLTFSASALTVYLTTDSTVVQVDPQGQMVVAEGGFTVRNTGTQAEFVTLAAEVLSAPPGWGEEGILCDKSGVCYAPVYRPGVPLLPGREWTNYVVHWDVPASGGTGRMRITATPDGQPQAVSELILTFTTEGAVRRGAPRVPAPASSRQVEP